mmetsp:Transcript_79418/g.184286  ORF Transcript_79418/g.184286 Transcript_79418/m.184286 type:complete len:210 (+) Transcript_79418:150-779(+)
MGFGHWFWWLPLPRARRRQCGIARGVRGPQVAESKASAGGTSEFEAARAGGWAAEREAQLLRDQRQELREWHPCNHAARAVQQGSLALPGQWPHQRLQHHQSPAAEPCHHNAPGTRVAAAARTDCRSASGRARTAAIRCQLRKSEELCACPPARPAGGGREAALVGSLRDAGAFCGARVARGCSAMGWAEVALLAWLCCLHPSLAVCMC